mgnify:CR=1 FL=1
MSALLELQSAVSLLSLTLRSTSLPDASRPGSVRGSHKRHCPRIPKHPREIFMQIRIFENRHVYIKIRDKAVVSLM